LGGKGRTCDSKKRKNGQSLPRKRDGNGTAFLVEKTKRGEQRDESRLDYRNIPVDFRSKGKRNVEKREGTNTPSVLTRSDLRTSPPSPRGYLSTVPKHFRQDKHHRRAVKTTKKNKGFGRLQIGTRHRRYPRVKGCNWSSSREAAPDSEAALALQKRRRGSLTQTLQIG